MRFQVAATIAVCAFAQPALGAKYELIVTGTISDIYSLDRNYNYVDRATRFSTGDLLSNTFVFDTDDYKLLNVFGDDPAISVYDGHLKSNTLKLGVYQSSFRPGDNSNSSIQLWNDYRGDPLYPLQFPTDFFQITGGQSVSAATSPVDFGNSGPVFITTSYIAFDQTGLARSSALISEITPLSSFAGLQGSASFFDRDFNVTSFTINITAASLTPLAAVPEPTTWAMMFIGFGVLGASMRYRRKSTAISFA
jgi:hypothetical protein